MAKPNFQDSVENKAFKASHFGKLFAQRKALFEGFCVPAKGLQFQEPELKFGKATQNWTSNGNFDKVSWKEGTREFQARAKKEKGSWDVLVKDKVTDDITGLVKYEQRPSSNTYVFGFDLVRGAMQASLKTSMALNQIKMSCAYDLGDIVKAAKLAADVKLVDMKPDKWNVGMSYDSAAGLTVLTLNDKNNVCANHTMKVMNETTAAVEARHSLNGNGTTVCAAVSHQLDKQHQLRARVNQSGFLNVMVKKDFSPNMSLLFSSIWNVQDPKSFQSVPAFGFKITMK